MKDLFLHQLSDFVYIQTADGSIKELKLVDNKITVVGQVRTTNFNVFAADLTDDTIVLLGVDESYSRKWQLDNLPTGKNDARTLTYYGQPKYGAFEKIVLPLNQE